MYQTLTCNSKFRYAFIFIIVCYIIHFSFLMSSVISLVIYCVMHFSFTLLYFHAVICFDSLFVILVSDLSLYLGYIASLFV